MENVSGASSSSSMVSFDDFEFEFVEEVECLSHWELLDASDADSEMFQIGDEGEGEAINVGDRVPDDLRDMISPVVSLPISLSEDLIKDHLDVYLLQHQDDFEYGYDGDRYDRDDEEEEDEIDEDGDECDLDDELVPWSVSSKFERQRMRKLGKRGFPKMFNSKRSPYLFTKPGCVRGKHGLGSKNSY